MFAGRPFHDHYVREASHPGGLLRRYFSDRLIRPNRLGARGFFRLLGHQLRDGPLLLLLLHHVVHDDVLRLLLLLLLRMPLVQVLFLQLQLQLQLLNRFWRESRFSFD